MTLTRIAAAAIASGIGFGAGMFGPAGIANAYTGSCVGPVGADSILQVREFSMQDAGNGNTLATVAVDAAMSESDAQLFVERAGDKADFYLFGDDTEDSDDLIVQFKPERYWVSPAGLGMRGAVQLPDLRLNEDSFHGFPPKLDPEFTEDETNEFYADIRMGDIRNGSAHRIETCRLRLPRPS
jgi:hypothetical protein